MPANTRPSPASQARADTHLSLVGDGLARITEAREFLGVSQSSVYKMMDNGDLPWVKLGKCRRIPWRALRELAARCVHGA